MARPQKLIKYFHSSEFESVRCYGFYKPRRNHEKKTILIFWVWPIMTFNPSFKVDQNPSNYNILVSAQPFSNLKIDLEIPHQINSIVKNQFLYFELLPFKNQGVSLSSLRARLKVVTPEKFSKHGFSFFHWIQPFFIESWSRCNFGCYI